jgi:tetratricopeptide (TPR) repeat protein
MADAVRIFISYAHQDNALRERLRVHLSQLERDGLVKAWDDREIPAGEEWADEIDERLESADIILLLVSADFIHSNFCYGKEMTRAIERNNAKDDRAIVIPIILRKCDWKSARFSSFQGLPPGLKPISEWKTEDDYFEAVVKGLRQRIEKMVPSEVAGAARPREPRWWERPRVRWALLVMAAVAGLAAWWWPMAAAAVDRETDASLTAFREGRYNDAKETLEKTWPLWIARSRARQALKKAELGVMLETEGNAIPVQQFAEGVNALLKENPNDPDLLFFAGKLAQHDPLAQPNQRVDNAIRNFEEATKKEPRFPEAFFNWGSLLLSKRDYQQALDVLTKAVKDAPYSPHYRNALAYAKQHTGDKTGAEDDYRRSAEDGLILSRLDLAELLWLSGRLREAKDQQEDALKELRDNNLGSKGHNATPWSFNLEAGGTVTLAALREKICYARLAWLASRALMSEPVQPEMEDCGPNASHIAQLVAESLDRALHNGLPEPAVINAREFSKALLGKSTTQVRGQ